MTRIDAKLGEYIREQRLSSRVSLRQLAAAAGVSNPYLSQVERGLRRPSAEILSRIATGLRISAESLYIRAGILQERSGSPDVLTALVADLTITERQRKVLLDIYSTFQAENSRDADAEGHPEMQAPATAGPATT
jgi:transcriptional regulator with XRE-family HTH domain